MRMANKLTTVQVAALGERLDGSSSNVYATAEHMFGFRPDESVFLDLAAAGYAMCMDCGVWQTFSAEMLADGPDVVCDACGY